MSVTDANQVVAVTGGASGLGHATARELSRRGARVAVIDLDGQAAEAAVRDLPGESIAIGADVTDSDAMRQAFEQIAARFGAGDVVMAGAGIVGWGPALVVDRETWVRTIETNVLGTWRTVHAAAPAPAGIQGLPTDRLVGFCLQPGTGRLGLRREQGSRRVIRPHADEDRARSSWRRGRSATTRSWTPRWSMRSKQTQPRRAHERRCRRRSGAPTRWTRRSRRPSPASTGERHASSSRALTVGAATAGFLWAAHRWGGHEGDARSRTHRAGTGW
ncbi:MAG: hypothetical protein DLM63_02310 [Solirubrobacterales bacterium]|nr:MAG: hypothetical protein DLM63_02310 [Solirubrobacterales bacterium]